MNEQGSCRLRLAQDNINRIDQISGGTGCAHESPHLSAEFAENIDNQSQTNQNKNVGKGSRIGSNRMDGGGHAENKHNIEDIGTDDISKGQAAFAFSGSGDRCHQFRQ